MLKDEATEQKENDITLKKIVVFFFQIFSSLFMKYESFCNYETEIQLKCDFFTIARREDFEILCDKHLNLLVVSKINKNTFYLYFLNSFFNQNIISDKFVYLYLTSFVFLLFR